MDCGIPFCNTGCPLGNLIPDWNDHVYRGRLAPPRIESLHSTNNFPEVTGRVCPAPCEASCVLNINDDPVSIKLIEHSIVDQRVRQNGSSTPRAAAAAHGQEGRRRRLRPRRARRRAAARRAGHSVTVLERRRSHRRASSRYGIPDFKMEKHMVDRRVEQMRAEGVEFRTGVDVGIDVTAEELARGLRRGRAWRIGSRKPRDLAGAGARARRASTSRWIS